MPNLTLTLEASLLKSARKLAAERETSVNQMVREYLQSIVAEQETHEARVAEMKSFFGKVVVDSNIPWKREDLYDRI